MSRVKQCVRIRVSRGRRMEALVILTVKTRQDAVGEILLELKFVDFPFKRLAVFLCVFISVIVLLFHVPLSYFLHVTRHGSDAPTRFLYKYVWLV